MFTSNHPAIELVEDNTSTLFDPNVRKSKSFKRLCKIVKEEGLEGLYQKLDDLNIGKKMFLSQDDWLYLASLDKKVHENNVSSIAVLHNTENNTQPFVKPHQLFSNTTTKKHPEVKEGNGDGMDYVMNTSFQSWEGTINNKPEIIFVPKTIVGLQNLVKWATEKNKKMRASGYHHTSSDLYTNDNQILYSMLDLKTVTKLPARHPKMDEKNEMQGIQLIGNPYEKDGRTKIKCKIGAATCSYQLQEWIHDIHGGNSAYTLPLNVIMSEVTLGGSIANSCHGAGIHNKTLSDLVTEIEFINAKGELQKVSDQDLIKAAAGCFGLLGPIVSLTLELDQMTYANLKTLEKKLIALTIPPPHDMTISSQLKKHLSRHNLDALAQPKLLQQAFNDFVSNCENRYYSEFFWFPLQEKGWINCWDNNGKKEKAKRYPNEISADIQRVGSYLAYLANNMINDDKEGPTFRKIQTKVMGSLAMAMLSNKPNKVSSVEDALHFRKGIHNFPTRMMEFEIPIPDIKGTNQPDWSICQKAWWAVIESIYSEENLKTFPMRTVLEMRIMGGSDVIMASQYQNKRTCAIEVLTPVSVNSERWDKFLQEILDKWSLLKDDQGNYLNIRPHWAKRFNNLTITRPKLWAESWDDEQRYQLRNYLKGERNMIALPMVDYLTAIACKKQIAAFKEKISVICKSGGYKLSDIQDRFSNSFLDLLMSRDPEFKLLRQNNFGLFRASDAKKVVERRDSLENIVSCSLEKQ